MDEKSQSTQANDDGSTLRGAFGERVIMPPPKSSSPKLSLEETPPVIQAQSAPVTPQATPIQPQNNTFSPTVITPNVGQNTQPQPSAPSVPEQSPANSLVTSPPSVSTPAPQASMPMGSYSDYSSKKRGFKKLIIVVLAFLVLLGGGGAGAYFGYYLPNKPDSVVTKALANLLNSKTTSFSSSAIFKSKDPVASTANIEYGFNGGIDESQNIRADVLFSFSVIKVTGSIIVRTSDKTLYVKVNELPSVLELIGGKSNPALSDLAQKLNQNWVKINVADLQSVGLLDEQGAAKANKCVNALADFMTSSQSSFRQSAVDAYKQNVFITASKAGSDSVNGVQATKYKLELDQNKAKAFANSLSEKTKSINDSLNKACPSSSSLSDKSKVDQVVTSNKINNTFAWISSDKKLLKLSSTITDGSNAFDVDLSVEFNNKPFDTSVPANVLTLDSLKADIDKVNSLFPYGSIGL